MTLLWLLRKYVGLLERSQLSLDAQLLLIGCGFLGIVLYESGLNDVDDNVLKLVDSYVIFIVVWFRLHPIIKLNRPFGSFYFRINNLLSLLESTAAKYG